MPSMLEAKIAQLAEVRTAISAILTRGQSFLVMDGGAQRQLTRANLKALEERERRLEQEVARLEQAEATGGGIRVNHGFYE